MAAHNYDGISGAELQSAIARDYAPARHLSIDEVYDALTVIDAVTPGLLRNCFGAEPIPEPLVTNGTFANILPATWWSIAAPGVDLHNALPAPADVTALMRDYPPGVVLKPEYDNGIWSVGRGLIGDVSVSFYTPPVGYEGDFARAAMYMAVIYGDADIMPGNAWNFFDGSRYPRISAHMLRQLIAWSDSDPVDTAERRRDDAISRIQGNHNPFVVHPELIRDIFMPGTTTPSDPSEPLLPEEQVEPLRATYHLSDSYIFLSSPYIADGAEWAIDGRKVDVDRVCPADLGVGRHALSFETGDLVGSLIIEIVP